MPFRFALASVTMSESKIGSTRRLWEHLLSYGSHPGESVEHRGRRRILVGALWAALPYIVLLVFVVGLIEHAPLVNAVQIGTGAVFLASLVLLRRHPRSYWAILQIPLAATIVGLLVMTLMLGGLFASGLIMAWGFLPVMGALVALGGRRALFWLAAFLASLILSVIIPNWVEPLYSWPDPEALGLFNFVGIAAFIFTVIAYSLRQRDRFQRQSDDLLHNILPNEVVVRLKQSSAMIADQFDEVSVLFADVVDFTPMSASMAPAELVGLLDDIFGVFDDFVTERGLEKIKTIGDEYMVAAGVPTPRDDHAHVIADLAVSMRDHVAEHEFAGHSIRLRIGIHSGPVVAGIIGHRKFSYDLWGDTVNTASRMESHGIAGEIQISSATHRLIMDRFACERRGTISVKGKGEVETWFLVDRLADHPIVE